MSSNKPKLKKLSGNKLSLLGSAILFIALWVFIYNLEGGDVNTIGLFLGLQIIPVVIIGIVNAGILKSASHYSIGIGRWIISFTPLLIMGVILITGIRFLDTSLEPLCHFGIVIFGITNIIWNLTHG